MNRTGHWAPASLCLLLLAALPTVPTQPAHRRLCSRASAVRHRRRATETASIHSISPDGTYVAFDSWATNLVEGDTNGFEDVFLRGPSP
jgi:hypothetical protein